VSARLLLTRENKDVLKAPVLASLGPRFCGDERLMVRRTLSPFVPAKAGTQGHKHRRSRWIVL
jgi:hypothetical protein